MNIAIVCYPTFGGSGVVATELGVALAHKGHQVHFITYGQPVRLSVFHKNIYFHQVYMEEYPLFRYQPYELALSSKMVEVVREYRIDVIHAHYDSSRLCRLYGKADSPAGGYLGGYYHHPTRYRYNPSGEPRVL